MTTRTILGTTVYGQPSGNYDGSSQDWFSNPVTAANYYRGRGGVQTIIFSVVGFEGTMYLDACLNEDPAEADWFNTYIYGDGSTLPITDYHPATVTGNFTWMRIRVEGFSGGTINDVTITY
jgi:hypothetical protein